MTTLEDFDRFSLDGIPPVTTLEVAGAIGQQYRGQGVEPHLKGRKGAYFWYDMGLNEFGVRPGIYDLRRGEQLDDLLLPLMQNTNVGRTIARALGSPAFAELLAVSDIPESVLALRYQKVSSYTICLHRDDEGLLEAVRDVLESRHG